MKALVLSFVMSLVVGSVNKCIGMYSPIDNGITHVVSTSTVKVYVKEFKGNRSPAIVSNND